MTYKGIIPHLSARHKVFTKKPQKGPAGLPAGPYPSVYRLMS
ncbi:hypothetical protein SUBVAR_06878 [Subdoligranulum variabile DSM 15176]|uniref:Uncharacterized protein n=1 Tax=Subdoligranulum variabile DSM 15176 TaxID=411471 RepID=D1PR50_9FIRM|nr:hypothetical protein SUBVAR_06878 [Subdoligranulum variabile DSM 15176]